MDTLILIILAVLGLLYLIGLGFVLISALRAPHGVEDELGFREVDPDEIIPKSAGE